MTAIQEAIAFSNERLTAARAAVEAVAPSRLVVTCGSYARREASAASDMDYYSILDSGSDATTKAAVNEAIQALGIRAPSSDGAFAQDITVDQLLENFGGSKDSNESITRRMLYLLEGDYLTKPEMFRQIRRDIISKYVSNTPKDHQIAFYLLNDIVRYWRTLAVDYAQKTSGSTNPKPWAVRNIKLVFSRKLIYASGIFSVALTADRTEDAKVAILDDLFSKTPIDRIKYVCGEGPSKRLFEMYDVFLDQIGDSDVRAQLDKLSPAEKATDSMFRQLKNEGHYFSRELIGLLQRTFHISHPIHMALIF